MIIRSNYRDGAKNQFEMEVLGETINNNGEECYLVKLLPKWQSEFQEKDSITELRKCLVGDSEELYSIVDNQPRYEQLTLF